MTTASVLFLAVGWKTLKGDTGFFFGSGVRWICVTPLFQKKIDGLRQLHFDCSSVMSGAYDIYIVQWMVL